ncbi:MAG TPA: deoxyribonuclease IV [bacterium]|jgi:deoxyribonuclease-4
MLIGAHVSVAGGMAKAFGWVEKFGCESLQVFTKSQVQWAAKPLEGDDIYAWLCAWENAEWPPCMVHNCYLINLSSADETLRQKSVAAMIDEVERAAVLGIPWVVTHPGASKGTTVEQALENCARSVREALEQTDGCGVGILLENTAGMGSHIGARFEELAQILQLTALPEQTGVCLDTCHAFAAGYDLRTAESYAGVWEQFGKTVGFPMLRAFHLNDCKSAFASHVDRHEAIGEGTISPKAFELLVNDPRFEGLPAVVELKDEHVPGSMELLLGMRQ